MKKKDIDFELVKELNLTMENEREIYEQENWLAKNYSKKIKKSKFEFPKAQQGVKNLIVTPFVRDYQKKWLGGAKVPSEVRDAVAKARLRAIMMRIREGDF